MDGPIDGPIRLVDHSNQMKHWSVEDMLIQALEEVRENPEAFRNAYLIMREDHDDGTMDIYHCRAGYRDGYESLGYLQVATNFRAEQLRNKLD